MTKAPSRLREDYLSGGGFFGQFVYPYQEELKKTDFFLRTVEDFVASSERDEVAELEKSIEGLSPEQRDEYWQWHYPIHWQEIFSNRLRASFIMQLCSFVEGELNEICQRVEVISQAPIEVGDLKGSTLSRPKKYLMAFARLDKPGEESWQLLERIFDVRNVMVHESGFAGAYRNHKKIVELASVAPGLSLRNDHIEVKRTFCEYGLKAVSEFCGQLHEAYEAFRATNQTLARLDGRSEV
jgi:hypothetical protein